MSTRCVDRRPFPRRRGEADEPPPPPQVQGQRGECESEPNAFVVDCEDADAPTLDELRRSCAFAGGGGDWRWRVRERDALFGYCWRDVMDAREPVAAVPSAGDFGETALVVHARVLDVSPAALERRRRKPPRLRSRAPASRGPAAPARAAARAAAFADDAPASVDAFYDDAPASVDAFYDDDGDELDCKRGDGDDGGFGYAPAAAAKPPPRRPPPTRSPPPPARLSPPPADRRTPPREPAPDLMAGMAAAPPPPPPPKPEKKPASQHLDKAGVEKLVREGKMAWDPVDERYVAVEGRAPAGRRSSIVGITLDGPLNTAGKAAHVASAMRERRASMVANQAAAKEALRERAAAKASEEAAFDDLHVKLGPLLKAWSEDHGKKKNVRALLAGMDKVMWPESNWTPISIGDLLDPKKVKRAYYKASRFVHPDKLVNLTTEQKFIGKRVFDALSQAYADFENGNHA